MATDLILGTAGHIDHGKTALVKALTGVDTDRLPEEKRRGITIDLGFAELPLGEFRLGIVDVPGHERFVRNMLAGATGIDLAMLVVAADESVKPQTREHLEILRLLQLRAGVIALTKCDLPEPDWIDLVEQEVRELVAGTFLADAPLVRTSAVTGLGLDALRAALADAARKAVAAGRGQIAGPFRMAIDRTFTVAGYGTVVTGSAQRGSTRVGDELAIEPGAIRVRVRGLENHGRPVDEIHRGQRAAINLAGVHHDQLGRGQELATPGHLAPSRRFSLRLHVLRSCPRPLKHRARVRLHIGTAEIMAAVVLLDRDAVAPGDWAMAQLLLAEPAVAAWGQPLVLRGESPAATLGGGQVLDPSAPKVRRRDQPAIGQLEALTAEDPTVRAAAALYFAGWRAWRPEDLTRLAGVEDVEAAYRQLIERGEVVEIAVSPQRSVGVHKLVIEELSERVVRLLNRMHQQHPLLSAFDLAQVASRFEYLRTETVGGDAAFNAVLQRMAAAGRILLTERGVALAGRGPQLSPQQRDLFERIVDGYRQAGFQPPTLEEVRSQASRNQAAVPELLELAVADGRLMRIDADLYLHVEWEQRMRATLAERLTGSEGLTVSQIREMLGTTRKYAVPLCEYLDRIGFTQRRGDVRVRKGG